jgi:very-short-patch-repair endonuclease
MGGKSWSYEAVKAYFADRGGTLLSTEYHRGAPPIQFRCSCGVEGSASFKLVRQWKNHIPCKVCAKQRQDKAHQKFDTASVRQYFAAHECLMLSAEYTGYNDPIQFQCPCGATYTTCFRVFKASGGIVRCPPCSMTRKITKERECHGGLTRFQTEEYKESRRARTLRDGADQSQTKETKAQRKKTILDRYGVDAVSKVPEIRERQKAGFRAKYGVDHYSQNPESVARFRATLMKNYGVPSLALVSGRASKAASEFFAKVFDGLPEELRDKCYYSPRTHEFNVWYEHTYYKYDFVQSSMKKCIEYNGSRFHPKPDQDDAETGWCLFRPTRTVAEARAYEAHKLGALRARGFQVLVIWDYEVKSDPDGSVQRCLDFVQAV